MDTCNVCDSHREKNVTIKKSKNYYHVFGLSLVLLYGFLIPTVGGQQLCQSSKPPYLTRLFVENIPENWPVDSVLSHLDIQGTDSEISLSLYTNAYLSLDEKSRNLTLEKRLDKENKESLDFTIQCTILSRSQSIDINGKVLILDVNDNPPIFDKVEYSANISEMAPIGTTVVAGMAATDADVDNWYITYELIEGPYSAFFNIPISSKGDIVLKKQLDYELTHQMQVTIMAKDNHQDVLGNPQPKLSATSTLVVNVYDGDDQNPAFLSAPYLAMVDENSPIGTILDVQPEIKSYDQDFGINASVQYSLEPDRINSEDDYFNIDSNSGQLELKKDALRRGTKFCLLIKATETTNPDRYATTSVRVWVHAANESPPKFVDKVYTANLVENAPVGSLVAVVTALDNDQDASDPLAGKASDGLTTEEDAVLSYSFGAPSFAEFAIDRRTGRIVTTSPLDFEGVTQYNLTVTVSDGQYDDEAVVRVNVINVNDVNPRFTQQLYEFKGAKETGALIGRIEAFGGDADSILKYRFVENSTLFTINNLGEILLSGDPDTIEQSEYRLFTVVEDNGIPPRQASSAVLVKYDEIKPPIGGPVSGATTGAGQTNLIVIIVLGVIAGVLVIIIVILCIYIYRKQSFEKGLNLDKQDYKTYMDITDQEGLGYTPAKDRHLQMYNDVSLEADSTTTQENPFSIENGYAHTNGNGRTPASQGYIHKNSHASLPTSSLNQYSSNVERSNGISEIEYATAITPLDRSSSDQQGSESTLCADSSIASSTQSVLDMSTFRGGSTQRLVSNPKGSQSSRKGSSVSSVNMKNKGSSVSFIDNHQVNVYNPQNAIDPHGSMLRQDRPGITVYY